MRSEKVIGNLKELSAAGREVDYIDVEWDEIQKRIQRKTTRNGKELGLILEPQIHRDGLGQDDVVYMDEQTVVAVNILPFDVLVIHVSDQIALPKLCYEIGNRHAPLFWGTENMQFITPYNEPTLKMLQKLPGIVVSKENLKVDLKKRISNSIHQHVH